MSNMKALIDQLVYEKAQGDSFQTLNVQFKLMLKGIPVKNIDESTPNDPEILEKIYSAAQDFNVSLKPLTA